MRAGDAALQAQPLGFEGQGLDVARQRVVGLVAMHVDRLAALGGDLAQQLHAGRAFAHGALEVRDAADDVDAQVQRALEAVGTALAAQHTVLREGHQLQVDVRGDAALDFQQGFDRQQARVAGVHVAADRQQALGHRPVAVGEGAFDDVLGLERRLEFAPELDAFQQGAALVDARQAVAERRVHVEMRVAKRRGEQVAGGVHGFVGGGGEAGRDFDDAAVLDGDGHAGAAVGEGGVGDEEVEHGFSPAGAQMGSATNWGQITIQDAALRRARRDYEIVL